MLIFKLIKCIYELNNSNTDSIDNKYKNIYNRGF